MGYQSSKYIIIGAGLSGLTTAHHLYKAGETDFLVLESRNTIGGRIMTKKGIDFGATWFQNHHHNVSTLLEDLGIQKFHQYNAGKSVLVYSTMAPAHYFQNDPDAPSAYRIEGGSLEMIKKLARTFQDKIKTDSTVLALTEGTNEIEVKTEKEIYKAAKVIVTIPPRIATRISFSPNLPKTVKQAMEKTHTWMSNAMKVGIGFKKPFWREKHYSGMVIGQVGAVTELYDHTDMENNHFALMGFINEGLRDFPAQERKSRILTYLTKYLGEEIMDYTYYEEKDWSQDRNTSCETIKSIYMSPVYGNPVFEHSYMDNKLYFSGAETSSLYGGYMDGAIHSGLLTAKKVLQSQL